jgi:hypothetical protein
MNIITSITPPFDLQLPNNLQVTLVQRGESKKKGAKQCVDSF